MQRTEPRCLIHLDRVNLFGRIEFAVVPVCPKEKGFHMVQGGGALRVPQEGGGLFLCRCSTAQKLNTHVLPADLQERR